MLGRLFPQPDGFEGVALACVAAPPDTLLVAPLDDLPKRLLDQHIASYPVAAHARGGERQVSKVAGLENLHDRVPWTPPEISEEEHRRQIEAAAAKPIPLSEGNAPLDRSILTPADPPDPAPLNPQHEQAMRLREFWDRSRIENPEGMPVGAIEVTEATREVVMEGGVEITKVKLNQGGYFAGPDGVEQPHAVTSRSSEKRTVPCPHCQVTGEVPFGWVRKDNGDAA